MATELVMALPAARALERRPTLDSMRVLGRWDTKRDVVQSAGTVEARDPWVIEWAKRLAERRSELVLPSSVGKGFITLQQLKHVLKQLPEQEVIEFNKLADEQLQSAVGTQGVQADPLQARLDAYLQKLQPQAQYLALEQETSRRHWTLAGEEGGPPEYMWLLEQYEKQQHAARVIQRAWRRWSKKCKEEGRPAWCLQRDLRRAKADLRVAYEAARTRGKQKGRRKNILPKELWLKYQSLMMAEAYISKIEQRDKMQLAGDVAQEGQEVSGEEGGPAAPQEEEVLAAQRLAEQIRAVVQQPEGIEEEGEEEGEGEQEGKGGEGEREGQEEERGQEEEPGEEEGGAGEMRPEHTTRAAGAAAAAAPTPRQPSRMSLQARSSDSGTFLQISSLQPPGWHSPARHSYSGSQPDTRTSTPRGAGQPRSRFGALPGTGQGDVAADSAGAATSPMMIRPMSLNGSRSSFGSLSGALDAQAAGAGASPHTRSLVKSTSSLQPSRQNRTFLLLQEMNGSATPPPQPHNAAEDDHGPSSAPSPAPISGPVSPYAYASLTPPKPSMVPISTPGTRIISCQLSPNHLLSPDTAAPPSSTPGGLASTSPLPSQGLFGHPHLAGTLTPPPMRLTRASWAASTPSSPMPPTYHPSPSLRAAAASPGPHFPGSATTPSSPLLLPDAHATPSSQLGTPMQHLPSPMRRRNSRTSTEPGAIPPSEQLPDSYHHHHHPHQGLHMRTSLTSQQAPAPQQDVQEAASCLRVMMLQDPPQQQGGSLSRASYTCPSSPSPGLYSPALPRHGLRTPGGGPTPAFDGAVPVMLPGISRRNSGTSSTPPIPPASNSSIQAAFGLVSTPYDAEPYVRQPPRQHPGMLRKPPAHGSAPHSPLTASRGATLMHRSMHNPLVLEQAHKLQLGAATASASGHASPHPEQQHGSALTSSPGLGQTHLPSLGSAARSPSQAGVAAAGMVGASATSLMSALLAARQRLKEGGGGGGGGSGDAGGSAQ